MMMEYEMVSSILFENSNNRRDQEWNPEEFHIQQNWALMSGYYNKQLPVF